MAICSPVLGQTVAGTLCSSAVLLGITFAVLWRWRARRVGNGVMNNRGVKVNVLFVSPLTWMSFCFPALPPQHMWITPTSTPTPTYPHPHTHTPTPIHTPTHTYTHMYKHTHSGHLSTSTTTLSPQSHLPPFPLLSLLTLSLQHLLPILLRWGVQDGDRPQRCGQLHSEGRVECNCTSVSR